MYPNVLSIPTFSGPTRVPRTRCRRSRRRRVADLSAGLSEALARWGGPAAIVVDSWCHATIIEGAEKVRFPVLEVISNVVEASTTATGTW